ncbi:MAPEG family protein [Tianweitania sp. BSSL-BM11]|uniref:MAPEG family protein n=1 Tax=Tianweitania aestuarii TaxID=2814886 RepID=A0ABS5RZ37_9HYPH|nr:MAPEG family protein [Tianweitania aestuarii]MBS9722291.1 MAPEG family protein [Tianweitania aestuarii]
MDTTLPTELLVLGWSVVLMLVYIFAHSQSATRDNGVGWNAGPRDETKPVSKLTGRLERAKWNFLETYPAFVALALGLVISGQASQWGEIGAILWFVARIVYLPLYAMGIPYIRSFVWMASLIGLLIMLGSFLG